MLNAYEIRKRMKLPAAVKDKFLRLAAVNCLASIVAGESNSFVKIIYKIIKMQLTIRIIRVTIY